MPPLVPELEVPAVVGGAKTPSAASWVNEAGKCGQAAVLFAPTMHGSMHTSILESNLRTLHACGCTIVPPRDEYGKHNLPDERTLVDACAAAFRAPRTPRPASRRD